ncbi:MAG: hypothetical protein ACK5GN_06515 [Pseudomonadota bacterium]
MKPATASDDNGALATQFHEISGLVNCLRIKEAQRKVISPARITNFRNSTT